MAAQPQRTVIWELAQQQNSEKYVRITETKVKYRQT